MYGHGNINYIINMHYVTYIILVTELNIIIISHRHVPPFLVCFLITFLSNIYLQQFIPIFIKDNTFLYTLQKLSLYLQRRIKCQYLFRPQQLQTEPNISNYSNNSEIRSLQSIPSDNKYPTNKVVE